MSIVKIKNKFLVLALAVVLAIGLIPTDVFAFEADNQRIAERVNNFSSISADGRYVAFASSSSNLVAGDTNNHTDIFVRDRDTNVVTRVSEGGTVGTPVQGNDDSSGPSISADGRYVAFESYTSNLTVGDTDSSDVFVMDRDTHTLTRVSEGGTVETPVLGSSDSYGPSISADGRYVAYYSYSNNLITGDTNARSDVFVTDRDTHTVTRVSEGGTSGTPIQGNDDSFNPSISADGAHVSFTSYANNLVTADTNNNDDVFVMYRTTHALTRVSEGGTSGTPIQGNNSASGSSISSDGRYVTFESNSDNLVPGDNNGVVYDVFVMDRDAHTLTRVSEGGTSGSPVGADASSGGSDISSDGRYVTYYSYATNLIPGDTNAYADIFVSDRDTHTITRVSEGGTSVSPVGGNHNSDSPTISSDGRFVVYYSRASNLIAGDTNGLPDAFISINVLFDDLDGATNSIENAAPNEGDANNDGVDDSFQQTVTSLVSPITSEYVVLESENCTANNAVSLAPETSNNQQDSDYSYPAGLLNFTLTGCTVGGTETITQYYYGTFDLANTVLRKYNSTTNQYATITGAVLSAVTIGGQSALKAVYLVTDGGALDQDGVANGTIIDPAGIAVLGVSAPNTGLAQAHIVWPIALIVIAGALVTVTKLYVKKYPRRK